MPDQNRFPLIALSNLFSVIRVYSPSFENRFDVALRSLLANRDIYNIIIITTTNINIFNALNVSMKSVRYTILECSPPLDWVPHQPLLQSREDLVSPGHY